MDRSYRRDRDDMHITENFYDEGPRRSPVQDSQRREYRSSNHRSQSSNRSRSSSPKRRDRSPWYGGAPSREIIMEHLSVDFTDKDVGHHSPF
jgi:hypothetical protein